MRLRRIVIILVAATVGSAQSFEVASIKPSGPKSVRGSEGGPGTSDPGRYSFNAASLDDLLVTAWHVEYFQISSKVPLDKQLFDLAAKVPAGATKEEFRAMLRNLLEERFHLQLHVQSKEFPGCELIVAKSGLKMKESGAATQESPRTPQSDAFPDMPPNRPGLSTRHTSSGGFEVIHLKAQQQPVSALAGALTSAERLIVDKTGLAGKYDFTLVFTKEGASAPPDGQQIPVAPNLFAAVQQQLGLQLVNKKIPLDVLIVDSFDKLPTGN